MKRPIFVITGTDTGVGKTLLTALLVRSFRQCGIGAVALKPVCSGGRDDARMLHAAMNGTLTLNEINPWHFRAPVTPMLAARRERRRIRLADVLTHIRTIQKRFEVVLVEGAGGLLSPLGEKFDSRDLLAALKATPIVVGFNRIGVINQVRLTLEALPPASASTARIVLMSPAKPDASTKTNVRLISEFFDAKRIFELPRFGKKPPTDVRLDARVRKVLHRLAKI